jgi:hypothetical protein
MIAAVVPLVVLGCGSTNDDGNGSGAAATSGTGSDGAATTGSGAGGGGGGTASTTGSGGSAPGSGGSATGTAGTGTATSSGGGDGTGATGGSSAGGMTGDLEPAPGEYGERAELPELNSEMAVAEVGGKIYVVGGYPSSREVQTTVQVYDIASNSWSLGTPLPMPIHHPVVVGALGKLYSLGGQTDGGDTDLTLVFDPAAPELGWVELMSMPTARGAGAGAVIDDKIYVVGGRPTAANNELEVYDIGEGQWAELAPLPPTFAERNHLAATAIGELVYVAGGRYDGGGFSDPRTNALDIYDPGSNTWSSGAAMLRERGGVNGVAAYGCFYVWGGEGSNIGEPNDVYPDHDVYDPVADEWTAVSPLPTPIHGVTGAAFVDGLIFMPGGGTQSGGTSGSNLFQVYRPEVRCE